MRVEPKINKNWAYTIIIDNFHISTSVLPKLFLQLNLIVHDRLKIDRITLSSNDIIWQNPQIKKIGKLKNRSFNLSKEESNKNNTTYQYMYLRNGDLTCMRFVIGKSRE